MLHTCIVQFREPRWLLDALVQACSSTVRSQVYKHLHFILSMALVGDDLLDTLQAMPRSRESFLHLHRQTLQATSLATANLWYMYTRVRRRYEETMDTNQQEQPRYVDAWSIPHFFEELRRALLCYEPEPEPEPEAEPEWHTQVREFLARRFGHRFCAGGAEHAPSLFIGQFHFALPRDATEAYDMYTCMSQCQRDCPLYVWWLECYMDHRHAPDMAKGIDAEQATTMWDTAWRKITATRTPGHTYAIATRLAYHVLLDSAQYHTVSDLCTIRTIDFLPRECTWWRKDIVQPLYIATCAAGDRTRMLITDYTEEIATTLCSHHSTDERKEYLRSLLFGPEQIRRIIRECQLVPNCVACLSSVLRSVAYE